MTETKQEHLYGSSRSPMSRYPIFIEATRIGFRSHVPDLPECIATGTTHDETLQRKREAMDLHR